MGPARRAKASEVLLISSPWPTEYRIMTQLGEVCAEGWSLDSTLNALRIRVAQMGGNLVMCVRIDANPFELPRFRVVGSAAIVEGLRL